MNVFPFVDFYFPISFLFACYIWLHWITLYPVHHTLKKQKLQQQQSKKQKRREKKVNRQTCVLNEMKCKSFQGHEV